MLENFEIKKTNNTPAVYFNKLGILKIMGRSLPEDTMQWYSKLKDVMTEFVKTGQSIEITIEMDYVNTSSSKALLDVLRIPIDNNIDVSIIWSYEVDDEDIMELGEFYEEALDIKFTFKEFSDLGLV